MIHVIKWKNTLLYIRYVFYINLQQNGWLSYIFYLIFHRGYDYDEISCEFRWPPLERDDGLIEIRDVWMVALGMLRGVDLQKHPLLSKRASTNVYSRNLWIDRQQLWRNTNVANCVFTPRRLPPLPATIDSRQRGLNDFPRSAIVLHLTH